MFKSEQLAENVTIYQGDCRKIIPTLAKVDAVISDPPYGIENIVGSYGRTGVNLKENRTIANDESLATMIDMLNLVKGKFDNIWLALFYSCRISPAFFQATSMLNYFGEFIWDKRVIGMGNSLRYQHENIGVFKIGRPAEEIANCGSILTYMIPKGTKSIHPHEKPNQVMHNLCRVIPGKMILDPFMGSGSTGAAAVQTGHGFAGIEWEEKFYDIARKKISDAIKQPVNFWE